MKYANGVQVNFVIEPGKGPMGGAVFICEKGKLEINRNKFTSNPPEIAQQLLKQLEHRGRRAQMERRSGALAGEMAHAKLDRLHSIARIARCRRGDRPPIHLGLPSGQHHSGRRQEHCVGIPRRNCFATIKRQTNFSRGSAEPVSNCQKLADFPRSVLEFWFPKLQATI